MISKAHIVFYFIEVQNIALENIMIAVYDKRAIMLYTGCF